MSTFVVVDDHDIDQIDYTATTNLWESQLQNDTLAYGGTYETYEPLQNAAHTASQGANPAQVRTGSSSTSTHQESRNDSRLPKSSLRPENSRVPQKSAYCTGKTTCTTKSGSG